MEGGVFACFLGGMVLVLCAVCIKFWWLKDDSFCRFRAFWFLFFGVNRRGRERKSLCYYARV